MGYLIRALFGKMQRGDHVRMFYRLIVRELVDLPISLSRWRCVEIIHKPVEMRGRGVT